MHHMVLHIFLHLTGVSYYVKIAHKGFVNCAKKLFGWADCAVILNETRTAEKLFSWADCAGNLFG